MRRLIYALSLLALMLSSCTRQPQPEHYLYLAIGQSNMVGKGEPEAQDLVPCPGFYNLASTDADDRQTGQWREALPGLCRPGHDYPNYVSPTDWFGRTLRRYLPAHVEVGVIQVAVDGCPLRLFDPEPTFCDSVQPDWMEGEIDAYARRPYDRLVTLARQAQSEGWQVKGLLVHQGETDAYSPAWPRELDRIYRHLLADLGLVADSVPIIVGEVVGIDQAGVCAHANPTLDHVADYIPTATTVSSRGCKVSPDGVHFATEGYRLLGTRYALRWLRLRGYDMPADTVPLQVQTGAPSDAFEVSACIRQGDGKLLIAATVSLASVDVVSFSGATLGTLDMGGASLGEYDITAWAGEDRLMLNIHSTEGQTVSRVVTRVQQ